MKTRYNYLLQTMEYRPANKMEKQRLKSLGITKRIDGWFSLEDKKPYRIDYGKLRIAKPVPLAWTWGYFNGKPIKSKNAFEPIDKPVRMYATNTVQDIGDIEDKWAEGYPKHVKVKVSKKYYEALKEDTNMSKIEELFGVKIGERFYLARGKYYGTIKNCWFGGTGKLVVPGKSDWETLDLLAELIVGEAKIVKIKTPILDEVEKKFIGNIIRPFDIEYIQKVTWSTREYYIFIQLKGDGCIPLPHFNKYSKMYAGMKPDKKYTPKDLGI